jgi:hypothetical protein
MTFRNCDSPGAGRAFSGDRKFVASNTRELMGVIVAVVVVDMLPTAEVLLQFGIVLGPFI